MTPTQLGNTAGKLLHYRLAQVGILDDLYSRISATTPAVVQEAGDADDKLTRMFRATARRYAMCFGFARLAVTANTLFTKRGFGFFPVPDKNAWGQFTAGVLEYATDSIQHPATRGEIIEDINDHQKAVARLCENYPLEAAPLILAATQQIDRIVSEVLVSL